MSAATQYVLNLYFGISYPFEYHNTIVKICAENPLYSGLTTNKDTIINDDTFIMGTNSSINPTIGFIAADSLTIGGTASNKPIVANGFDATKLEALTKKHNTTCINMGELQAYIAGKLKRAAIKPNVLHYGWIAMTCESARIDYQI